MTYTLIRSKRKTIAIYIKDAAIEVRAPLGLPKREIDTFVAKKEKWIRSNLQKSQEWLDGRENFQLDYGDTIPLRGRECKITARDGRYAGFADGCFYMPPSLTPVQIKETCVQIYRRLAKVHLDARVSFFASTLGTAAKTIKINGATTRWGSCSAKKNINFSWRLIMADDRAIDYVVVHELAHLTEHNHSPKFWAIVAAVLPDYKEREEELKKLHKKLAQEDWS